MSRKYVEDVMSLQEIKETVIYMGAYTVLGQPIGFFYQGIEFRMLSGDLYLANIGQLTYKMGDNHVLVTWPDGYSAVVTRKYFEDNLELID